MTPTIRFATGFQIAILADRIASAMRTAGFPGDLFQEVLDHQPDLLTPELLAVVRKHVEGGETMIIRRVHVDRTRTRQQIIDATGRIQFVDPKVVADMPLGEDDEVDVCIFKPGPEAYKDGFISCEEVTRQFDGRGLRQDPCAVAAMNEANTSLADEHPHGAQWLGDGPDHRFACFSGKGSSRRVTVNRFLYKWEEYWSFAGVRK